MTADAPGLFPCPECAKGDDRCSECQHPHEWYDHVGPDEHMCQWCLVADYDNDPLGKGPYSRP